MDIRARLCSTAKPQMEVWQPWGSWDWLRLKFSNFCSSFFIGIESHLLRTAWCYNSTILVKSPTRAWGHSGDLTAVLASGVGHSMTQFVKSPVFPHPLRKWGEGEGDRNWQIHYIQWLPDSYVITSLRFITSYSWFEQIKLWKLKTPCYSTAFIITCFERWTQEASLHSSTLLGSKLHGPPIGRAGYPFHNPNPTATDDLDVMIKCISLYNTDKQQQVPCLWEMKKPQKL